jgi:RNA polymerase sigma-70 factor (ECF subfamily)
MSGEVTTSPGMDGTFTGWVSELARRHARALAAVARREGLSSDDALDAVQEAFHTFLGLPQARELADGDPDAGDAQRLLTALVRNAARNMRRRHFRARPHEALDEDRAATAARRVDDLLAEAEDHIQLTGCLFKLGDLQRRVVTLRMLEELSGAEVAAELGLTAGHVAVLLHRAKNDLLRCLCE